jgi:type III pantothenate kinase
MNALLIDAGNSKVAVARIALVDGAMVGPLDRLWTGETPREHPAALATTVAAHHQRGELAGLTSVVPSVSEALLAALPDLRCVDHTWNFPFAMDVDHPETVGTDRFCNMAAAVAEGYGDAIVVDAGTATTIDVLRDGRFVGGLIAPGMAFAARKLQEEGALLWTVPFERTELAPGRDTASALAIGAYQVGVRGIVGAVEGLLADLPEAQVVVTGGLGVHVTRGDWLHDPDWTLRGLATLLLA